VTSDPSSFEGQASRDFKAFVFQKVKREVKLLQINLTNALRYMNLRITSQGCWNISHQFHTDGPWMAGWSALYGYVTFFLQVILLSLLLLGQNIQ